MGYEVNRGKSYNRPAPELNRLAAAALAKLGGKTEQKSNQPAGQIEVVFNKQVKNHMLPNRIRLLVKLEAASPESCQVLTLAYPVDPLGNKLMFGVRGNATATVVDCFWEELETLVSL